MLYLFIFVAFLFINYIVYSEFGIQGLLILHFAIFTTILIMMYDKLTNFFTEKKKPAAVDEKEARRLAKEYEQSKNHFKERDLPDSKDIDEMNKPSN